jgi:hypothetical protein
MLIFLLLPLLLLSPILCMLIIHQLLQVFMQKLFKLTIVLACLLHYVHHVLYLRKQVASFTQSLTGLLMSR